MLVVALSASLFGVSPKLETKKKADQEKQEKQQIAQDERARDATAGGVNSSSQVPRGTVFSPEAQAKKSSSAPDVLTPTTDSMRAGAAANLTEEDNKILVLRKNFLAELEDDLHEWNSQDSNDGNSVASNVIESTAYLFEKYSSAKAEMSSLELDRNYQVTLKKMIEKASELDKAGKIDEASSYDDRISCFVLSFMIGEGVKAKNFLTAYRANEERQAIEKVEEKDQSFMTITISSSPGVGRSDLTGANDTVTRFSDAEVAAATQAVQIGVPRSFINARSLAGSAAILTVSSAALFCLYEWYLQHFPSTTSS